MNGAGRMLALVAILVLRASASGPRVTTSYVTGRFFANPSGAGEFSATPRSPVLFSQRFLAINFNPPRDAIHCSNPIDVDEWHRPFSDVVVHADGSCSAVVAQGNGQQAGSGKLEQFNAVFTGTFTVSAPGRVTFNIYGDDGWILGIGRGNGVQPTYLGGPRENAPTVTPFSHLRVVGAYNMATAPERQDLVVNFPSSGTFAFELDYSECCGGPLALTLTADAVAIASRSDEPFESVGDMLIIGIGIGISIPILKKWIARNDPKHRLQIQRRGFAVRVSGDIRGGPQTAYRLEIRGAGDGNPGRSQGEQ